MSGSISKTHQLTNLNKCGKFHACIQNSTILALCRLANNNNDNNNNNKNNINKNNNKSGETIDTSMYQYTNTAYT